MNRCVAYRISIDYLCSPRIKVLSNRECIIWQRQMENLKFLSSDDPTQKLRRPKLYVYKAFITTNLPKH